jgi:hypothetical protein
MIETVVVKFKYESETDEAHCLDDAADDKKQNRHEIPDIAFIRFDLSDDQHKDGKHIDDGIERKKRKRETVIDDVDDRDDKRSGQTADQKAFWTFLLI